MEHNNQGLIQQLNELSAKYTAQQEFIEELQRELSNTQDSKFDYVFFTHSSTHSP